MRGQMNASYYAKIVMKQTEQNQLSLTDSWRSVNRQQMTSYFLQEHVYFHLQAWIVDVSQSQECTSLEETCDNEIITVIYSTVWDEQHKYLNIFRQEEDQPMPSLKYTIIVCEERIIECAQLNHNIILHSNTHFKQIWCTSCLQHVGNVWDRNSVDCLVS